MNTSEKTRQELLDQLQESTSRMMEAEETLRSIIGGEVDGLVVSTGEGDRVFTLSGADQPYRVMVETMNEGAVTLASDGTILFCNQCFGDIVKGPLENIIGSSIYHYISSTDRKLFEVILEQGLKGNSKAELVLQAGSDHPIPVLLSISALQHGDVPGVACMVVADLTEQKNNEEMLAEEKLTSEILNQAGEIFVLCDRKGRIIRASQSTSRLLGGSPVFQAFDEAFHLLHADGTPFILLSAMEDNSLHGVEVMLTHGEIESSFFLLSANSLITHNDVIGIIIVMADITERKKIEGALINSETRYRRLFETARDGILLLDAETGRISDVNPFLLDMLGYSYEDFVGKRLWEIGTFKDIEASKAIFSKLQENGYVRYEDLPLETKDGHPVDVEFVSNVYLVHHHKVIQCNIREITERKRLADSLQRAHNELENRVAERTVELQTALSEINTLKERFEAENIYFRRENKLKHQFENIIGISDGLQYLLYRAEQVAPTNTTVLILGETGTGKELIASAIHDMSPRKDRPLITVNCAALPGNLIESELFGREKGAFTGADSRQTGRFEIANGSTLCLDEIGELPLELQAKLLRVIQHNEFERLGSSHTIKVDVRIVATTNRDLEEEVRKGRFRQDLFYRLNVFPITVPPLRQRKDDIPLMVHTFIERYSRNMGKEIKSIQKETMKTLQDYPWPGNVRELENIIERAVILCPGPVLQLADTLEISIPSRSSSVRTLEETERNQILTVLSDTRWRIEGRDGAATILGIHPSTLRARMHKLGIVRPVAINPVKTVYPT